MSMCLYQQACNVVFHNWHLSCESLFYWHRPTLHLWTLLWRHRFSMMCCYHLLVSFVRYGEYRFPPFRTSRDYLLSTAIMKFFCFELFYHGTATPMETRCRDKTSAMLDSAKEKHQKNVRSKTARVAVSTRIEGIAWSEDMSRWMLYNISCSCQLWPIHPSVLVSSSLSWKTLALVCKR